MTRRKTRAELDGEQEAAIQALMEVPDEELACRDPGLAHQWNLTENYHVIQARYRNVSMSMIARDSECQRCGKTKQERWLIGKGDLLHKTGNHYSPYTVQMHGFSRGRLRGATVWTAGYRKALQAAAEEAAAADPKPTRRMRAVR
jgi:hypothetical protein